MNKYSLENISSSPTSTKFKSIFRNNNNINSYKTSDLIDKCSSETDVFYFNQKLKKTSKSEENLLEKNQFNKLCKSSSLDKQKKFKEETEFIPIKALEVTKQEQEDLSLDEPDLAKTNLIHTKPRSQSNEFIDNLENCVDKMMPPPVCVMTDSQGLIVPKKLQNPCLESHDRQNLHRELLFNQKVGKSVLNQKSELQKALEKQKERQMISTQQQQHKQENIGGELERAILQRAQRLEIGQQNNSDKDELNHVNPEYLNARAKLRARIDTK